MTSTLFQDALRRLGEAARHIEVSPDTLERLRHPRAILQASCPVRMDDGALRTFTGYRVRHDDSRGPAKGGIRFHPSVNVDEVQSLAFWMTFKCALLSLPFGGGKGGVTVDPKQLSLHELERLSRSYIRAIADFIGPDVDIPAPDVYTNARIMGWMLDEYNHITRSLQPAVITGKPLSMGGSLGRDTATAQGGFHVIWRVLEHAGREPRECRFAIQGFGNAGATAARLLHEAGCRVVAVSDSSAALFRGDGLDVPAVTAHKAAGRPLSSCDLPGVERITNEELLALDVDVLVPAALEGQFTGANAGSVRARFILELANGPVTSAADEILHDAGCVVIPDILANAGGVTVSYFEWVQNREGWYWTEQLVQERLRERMLAETGNLLRFVEEKGTAPRVAAYAIALSRLEAVSRDRGTASHYRGEVT